MEPERKSAVIVVVDDDGAIRSLFEDVFVDRGHTVSTAGSVAAGLVACAAAHPDVVIVDMKMPGENGIVLIDALRRAPASPRIVAISGGGTEGGFDLLEKAHDAGADVTLHKPVRIDVMIEVVENLLAA